jgi:hypothetical protein
MCIVKLLIKITRLFGRLSQDNLNKAEYYADISFNLKNNEYFYLSVLIAKHYINLSRFFYWLGSLTTGVLRAIHSS